MRRKALETARAVKLRPIQEVAESLGLTSRDLEPYGSDKAKIRWEVVERVADRPDGALVLVTAMTPTPAGEGKTTTTIGLADGLRRLGARAVVPRRDPPLGPAVGPKGGGAAGGVVGETAAGGLGAAGGRRAGGAMAVLMKDAIKPNLVQTLEATPALVHGGPFGNIAHGCNTLIATSLGLKLGEILVTEAGFATELGMEKFLDIKCRAGAPLPAPVLVVATVRGLKLHRGLAPPALARA